MSKNSVNLELISRLLVIFLSAQLTQKRNNGLSSLITHFLIEDVIDLVVTGPQVAPAERAVVFTLVKIVKTKDETVEGKEEEEHHEELPGLGSQALPDSGVPDLFTVETLDVEVVGRPLGDQHPLLVVVPIPNSKRH